MSESEIKSEISDYKDAYKIKRAYRIEGLYFYLDLLRALLENNQISSKPELIILMGGPGSGKSSMYDYMINNNYIQKDNYVYLNRDDIISRMPDYQNIFSNNILIENTNLTSGLFFMTEADIYFEKIKDLCKKENRSIFLDITGQDPYKISRIIDDFREEDSLKKTLSYSVSIIHIDVDIKRLNMEKIIKRILERTEKNKRTVMNLNIQMITESYKKIKKSFERIKKITKEGEEEGKKINFFSCKNNPDPNGESFMRGACTNQLQFFNNNQKFRSAAGKKSQKNKKNKKNITKKLLI